MKKTSILIAVFTMITAASAVRAAAPQINFDGKTTGAMDLTAVITAARENTAGRELAVVPPPTPSVETLFSYNGIGEMDKIAQAQPAIKAFVASYNQHVLHDTKVGADLQLEGVVIALKLPGQVLVTKNGEVLDTIDNAIMANTIRHDFGGSNPAVTRNAGKCLVWIAEVVAIWVIDHYIEKTVKKCSEWEPEPKPSTTPSPSTVDQHPEQPQHWQHQY